MIEAPTATSELRVCGSDCRAWTDWRGSSQDNRVAWKAVCSVLLLGYGAWYFSLVADSATLLIIGAVWVIKLVVEIWGQHTPTWACPGSWQLFLVVYALGLPSVVWMFGACRVVDVYAAPSTRALSVRDSWAWRVAGTSHTARRPAWRCTSSARATRWATRSIASAGRRGPRTRASCTPSASPRTAYRSKQGPADKRSLTLLATLRWLRFVCTDARFLLLPFRSLIPLPHYSSPFFLHRRYCIHPNYFGDLFTYGGWGLACGTQCAMSPALLSLFYLTLFVVPNSDACDAAPPRMSNPRRSGHACKTGGHMLGRDGS